MAPCSRSAIVRALLFYATAMASATDATDVLRERLPLNDGNFMPRVGLGVYKTTPGPATFNAVSAALKAGYRLVDTAHIYDNEASVGEAIAASGVPREEIFVTTKLWADAHSFRGALRAADVSLQKLGLPYVDLYLVHAPIAGHLVEVWDALLLLKVSDKREGLRC